MSDTNVSADASSSFPWPPVVYGLALVLSVILSWLLPLPFLPGAAVLAVRIIGIVMVLAALGLMVAAELQFRRAGTPALPTLPTRSIVDTGVFAYSRNPMYVGFTGVLVGAGLAADSLWFLIAAPFAVLAVTRLAIDREEAYLAGKFGKTYRLYRARVRRWV